MILDQEEGRWEFIAPTILYRCACFLCKNMGSQKDTMLFAFIFLHVILFALLLMFMHFLMLLSE